MTGRKIDVSEYPVPVGNNGDTIQYKVRQSLVALLLGTHRQLNAVELLGANKLAQRILDESGESDEVLLSQQEYGELQGAINGFRGYGQQDVGMVERVLNAPEVELQETH